MNRRQPLWFFIDAVAQLRVFASFVRFAIASHFAFARARPHNGTNRLLAPDVHWLSAVLATAEADLTWALARRAAAIAGVDPGRIVHTNLSPAGTRHTLWMRARIYCKRFHDFELVAQKMAAG
jgi:hypothetical protein